MGIGVRGLTRGLATLPQGNQEPLVVKDKVGSLPGEQWYILLSAIRRSWVLVCWWWWWWLNWSFACLLAPAVTTTCNTLSSNEIQYVDIRVPAGYLWELLSSELTYLLTYPGCPGKWPLNEGHCRIIADTMCFCYCSSSYIHSQSITDQVPQKSPTWKSPKPTEPFQG